jgi:hypothetical protein
MHTVFVTLDSLGPAVFIGFGLSLILGSRLLGRRTSDPAPRVVVGNRDAIEVRIRSEKVVPINRGTRFSKPAAMPVRRVGNFS